MKFLIPDADGLGPNEHLAMVIPEPADGSDRRPIVVASDEEVGGCLRTVYRALIQLESEDLQYLTSNGGKFWVLFLEVVPPFGLMPYGEPKESPFLDSSQSSNAKPPLPRWSDIPQHDQH